MKRDPGSSLSNNPWRIILRRGIGGGSASTAGAPHLFMLCSLCDFRAPLGGVAMVNLRKVVDLGYLFSNGGTLACRCRRCGHAQSLSAGPLMRRFGAGCPTSRLERYLTCSDCGHKGATVSAVWPPDPEAGTRMVDQHPTS